MTISIITVNRNNREGLHKTIKSVLQQTERPYEFIVIDGASTDGSADLLKEYHEQITYSVSEPDNGIYNAMNKGVTAASGDYLLFVNSGDRLISPDALERISPYLDGTDIISGKMKYDNGEEMYADKNLSLLYFFKRSLPHCSTFIKADLLKTNPYNENLKIVSDWQFFLESIVLNNCTFSIIDEYVAIFEGGGISARNNYIGDAERRLVLSSLFPDRVLIDYLQFTQGKGYVNTSYDIFYRKLRDYRLGKLIYRMNLIIVRGVGLLRKSFRWAWKIA